MRCILVCALILSLVYLIQHRPNPPGGAQAFWIFFFLSQAYFNFFISFFPWYRQNKLKNPGITLHFQKTLSPLSYIWFLGSLSLVFNLPYPLIAFFGILLSPLSLVCCILIFFYLKDPERQKVNILTGHEK